MGGGHESHEIRQRGGMGPRRVSRRAGRGERDGVSLPRGRGEDEEGSEMPDHRGGTSAVGGSRGWNWSIGSGGLRITLMLRGCCSLIRIYVADVADPGAPPP